MRAGRRAVEVTRKAPLCPARGGFCLPGLNTPVVRKIIGVTSLLALLVTVLTACGGPSYRVRVLLAAHHERQPQSRPHELPTPMLVR